MFSPEASIQSARSSLRNPRRRQRKDSDGPQQLPRRKRSKLNDETYQKPTEAHINGDANINGHAVQSTVENSMVVVDMPVREKAPSKRAVKDDDADYLTRNPKYVVTRLPGFPSKLLKPSTPFYGTALPSAGLALALTFDRAFVWEYLVSSGAPKAVTIPLHLGLQASDPLPLGAIVRNGPTNDYGVVAIAPSTGKISFWENIDNEYARGLYSQHQQGVEGSVKVYTGETITDLVDVDHAGFILVLSSGRLAQLTLRDPQGRPSITTTVLNGARSSSGSFFSLKGLLGGGIRKTIASVKARQAGSKGHMEVVSATRAALFQIWDLNWSGQHQHQADVNAQAEILSALQTDVPAELRSQQDVQVLDFAIMEQPQSEAGMSLLTLVALSGRESLEYSLVEVELSQEGAKVTRTLPVRHYHQTTLPKEPTGTLLLPKPGHTAYVQFPGAIFVTSLVEPEEGPEAQLLADAGRSTLPFQDTMYFRKDINVVCSGAACDISRRRDDRSIALLFIQGVGLLQVITRAPTANDEENGCARVTARSKLEQATLYSCVQNNILDFSVRSRFSFSEEETEHAAITISSLILSSSLPGLQNTTSMDEHFKKRASHLATMISQLHSDYPQLSFAAKWQLLAHAEKLATAHKLWNWHQDKLHDQKLHPDAYPEDPLMGNIVKALNERYKTAVPAGEEDPIRHFFLKDIDNINILIPWGWFYLRTFYISKADKEPKQVMQKLSEGTDVMLVSLETAFQFRQTHIGLYGLDADSLEDGVLKANGGYDKLPAFWTSSHNIVSSIRSLVDVGRNLAVENYEEGLQEVLSQKIGGDNPRLVRVGCQTHIERFRWALAQSDEKTMEMGRSLKEEWNTNVRPTHIMGLLEVGLATEGMKLAEQYHDMPTLVNLIWEESNWLESQKASTRSKMEQAESSVKLNRIKERVSRYFDTYGEDWAEAFYSKYINENQAAQLFMKEYLNQPALTKYLRSDSSRARLAWINEVCGEKNFENAASCLYTAAKHETNSWCQRVELSIAKLAMLCKQDGRPDQTPEISAEPKEQRLARKRDERLKSIESQLEYTKIQDEIYNRLLPTITGALDDESAVELLMEAFGQGRLEHRPAHQAILREGFENLIHNKAIDPALMVDILTLMDSTESDEEIVSLLQTNEFNFAFRVLIINYPNMNRANRDSLIKLVWKRLCIQDDWETINKTKNLPDAEVQALLANTTVGWTLRGICRMMDEDPSARLAPPKDLNELLGAGGTHGELCVRFASEDLRDPIIKDNLLDDDILKEHMEHNRLQEWFWAACKAGKQAWLDEKIQARLAAEDTNADTAQVPQNVEALIADSETCIIEESTGDAEQSQEEMRDVEMQES